MSISSLALDAVLRRTNRRSASERAARVPSQPGAAPVPRAVAGRFGITEVIRHGCRVVTLRHPRPTSSRVVIFLAGGGYAKPITASHWNAIAQHAGAAGLDVVVPLYDVAPRGDAEKAHALLHDVLTEAVAMRGPGEVFLSGDSAGAGLALSALQRRPDGIRAAVLFNPWLDVETAHPATGALQRWDPVLDVDELRRWGRIWAGRLDPADPAVSPLNGPMTGLPPVHIVTGGRDLLMPQALDAHRLLQDAGNGGSLSYAPDANHAVGLLRGATPEARRVHRDVVRILQS